MIRTIQMHALKVLALTLVAVFGLQGVARVSAEDMKGPAIREYDAAAAEAAMKANKPVLFVFAKSGCSVCAKQDEALGKLLSEGDLKMVTAFKVDFDKAQELNRKLKVSSQSTLIGFKGTDEAGRVVGETNSDKLKEFLVKTFCS